MRKFKFVAVVLVSLLAIGAFSVQAATFSVPEDEKDATVTIDGASDDVYAAASMLNIKGTLTDDLFGGASIISATPESVAGDMMLAGSSVEVKTDVSDDVYLAGSFVKYEGTVGDDLFMAGSMVLLDGVVGGDVRVGAASVDISGEYSGSVYIASEDVNIASDTFISGDLVTVKNANITKGQNVQVLGEERVMNLGNVNASKDSRGIASSVFKWVIFTAGLIVVMLIITALAPLKSRDVLSAMSSKPWRSLGVGALCLIVTPIAAVIMLVTVVLLPLGLISLFFYALGLYVSIGFLGLFLGMMFFKYAMPNMVKKGYSMIISIILGVIVATLLSKIPLFGGLIVFLGMLFALGAMFDVFRNTTIKKRPYFKKAE